MLMPPRRILMLAACPFPSPQGSQVFIRHLANVLSDAGHGVHLVCYGRGSSTPPNPLRFTVHRAPGPPVGARSGPSLGKPLADAGLFACAAQLLRGGGFDLIHAHNVEGQAVGIALRALFGVPLVYHCHNAMVSELPTYFTGAIPRRLARLAGFGLDTWLPRLADAVITFDAAHAAVHVARGARPDRVHVIPPGLGEDELRPAPRAAVNALRQHLGHGPIALYAGNPDAYQNLELLWGAWAHVRRKLPAAQLLIASHHPPEAFGPERPGVRHLPSRTFASVQAAHALAHVAVCPRAVATGAPIKVLNYMAAGLPVIACRAASRELVPATAGQLVEGASQAFAEAMLNGLSAPRHRVHLPVRLRLKAQLSAYAAVYAVASPAAGRQSLGPAP